MTAVLSLTETQIFTALRGFLTGILPAGMPVVRGQVNRVSQPAQPDHLVMWPVLRERLSTNIDTAIECAFTGSIAGPVLTVASVDWGFLALGSLVNDPAVAPGTTVTAFGTGTGLAGTYTVSVPQVVASLPLHAGFKAILERVQITVQCDVHGPASADNSQVIEAVFRDETACQAFTDTGLDLQPLYTSDPRQIPFINGEGQYENRWSIDLTMQANPVITVAQQFAGIVTIIFDVADGPLPPVNSLNLIGGGPLLLLGSGPLFLLPPPALITV